MAVVSQAITPEVLTTRRPTGALLRSALGLRRTQIGTSGSAARSQRLRWHSK